jgi:putative DNA primase/helicase
MARPSAKGDYYTQKGLRTRRSGKREDTEAGRLAAYIIDRIPEGFDVYEDCDISEGHLADEIVATCGRYIRHCPQIGWMVWHAAEGRWTDRYAEAVVQRVITHFGHLLWEGALETHAGETAFSRYVLSSGGISAMKRILKHHTVIAVEQDRFDADGYLLNCMGDLYDLRTGESRPAEPEDLLTKTALCKAGKLRLPDGFRMPEWPKELAKFMGKVTSKDGQMRPDLAVYILSYFGYCLTGDNGASFFVNFHGEGRNGKSQLLMLMMELFGDYAAPIPKDIVIENRFGSQFDLAGLPGVRLGVLIDAPDGRLNMDLLKPIISGDTINAKRKYLEDFKFKPMCKIAVGSNPKLDLKDTGLAVRRRVRMVSFDYRVPPEEDVANFHKRLLEEGPEILALLIWFAGEYYRWGEGPKAFPPCAVVDEASREYMDSQDLVLRWKKERTEAAPGNRESSADLYNDFKKWATDEGVRKVMQRNTFGEHLAAHVERKRIGDPYFYLGIKLKARPPGGGAG